MLYSKSTCGFYSREIHGHNIPSDAVEITSEEHAALLQGQSEGKIISSDKDGFPVLTDKPYVVPDYSALRESAYRAESDPIFFKEQRGEVPVGTWLAAVNEIKSRWPE